MAKIVFPRLRSFNRTVLRRKRIARNRIKFIGESDPPSLCRRSLAKSTSEQRRKQSATEKSPREDLESRPKDMQSESKTGQRTGARDDSRMIFKVAEFQLMRISVTAFMTLLVGWYLLGQWQSGQFLEIDRVKPETIEFGLNPNFATQSEWEALPGIGPKRAADLVANRERHGPFQNLQDLERVKGIGRLTAQRLAPYLDFEQAETNDPYPQRTEW